MADLLAMVVDSSNWDNLLSISASELEQAMFGKKLRNSRPDEDPSLERRHDVDVEAEILDWLDSCQIIGDKSVINSALEKMAEGGDVESIAEGIWLLAEWSSKGTWRCMEGRGFLYLEPYIESKMDGVSELYLEETWSATVSTLKTMTADEFEESVVLDWLARREELGDTLDQKQDPRILSTMQSHQRLARSLHQVAMLIDQEQHTLLTRRDWSSFLTAGFGGFNIGTLLSGSERRTNDE